MEAGGDDMRDIGRNIRCVRVRRGLTQEELAERLHVSRQTVSNYETGRSRPDVDMLLLAAEKLEVDVQVLLYGEPVQTQRRREVYLLLAEGAALLALGVGLRLCDRWARRLLMRGFAGGPLYLIRCTAVPAFWFLLGWVLLQACGTFLGAKPLKYGWARPLRRAVAACLAAWAVLELPVVAGAAWQTVYALLQTPEASLDLGISLPRWWEKASFWVQIYLTDRFPAVFLLFGAVLWSTRPAGGQETV